MAALATFALIHGGGGSAWDWHLVVPALRNSGHEAVAVDLPCEVPTAGWEEYTGAVVHAIGARREVVVVGHSLGGSRRRSYASGFASISSSSSLR